MNTFGRLFCLSAFFVSTLTAPAAVVYVFREVPLVIDAAASTPTTLGSAANTLNDPFAYKTDSPTSPMPERAGAESAGYRGDVPDGQTIELRYNLAEPIVESDGDQLYIDLYGPATGSEHNGNISVKMLVLYNGKEVALYDPTMISKSIPASGHLRLNPPIPDGFIGFRISASDSSPGDGSNQFTLMEVRSGIRGIDADAGGTIEWYTSKELAVQAALEQGKQIFVLSGRGSCANCMNTKYYWCEHASVKPLIEQLFICYYLHVDDERPTWDYYRTHIASGSFFRDLPGTFFLDPKDTTMAHDMADGTQYYNALLARFQPYLSTRTSMTDWASAISGGQEGDTDSPAGDGVPNLLKYACGLNPMAYCASTNLMQSAFNTQSNVFEMTFFKSLTRVDVQVEPEWRSSLIGSSWTNVHYSYEGDENGREKWKATAPPGTQGFIRLKAIKEGH